MKNHQSEKTAQNCLTEIPLFEEKGNFVENWCKTSPSKELDFLKL